jgi:hypothetical protein
MGCLHWSFVDCLLSFASFLWKLDGEGGDVDLCNFRVKIDKVSWKFEGGKSV